MCLVLPGKPVCDLLLGKDHQVVCGVGCRFAGPVFRLGVQVRRCLRLTTQPFVLIPGSVKSAAMVRPLAHCHTYAFTLCFKWGTCNAESKSQLMSVPPVGLADVITEGKQTKDGGTLK